MRALALAALALAACSSDRATPAPPIAPIADAAAAHERELAHLLAFEERHRGELDFATLAPSDVALGPDPYRVASLRDGARVGILRGESAIVLIDAAGAERARAAAPRSPSGLAVSATGDVLVVGDGARDAARFRVDDGRLVRAGSLAIGALGMRDVALSSDGATAYVVEEHDGRLLAIALAAGTVRELGRCHGPTLVRTVADYVATNCLLDHAIEVRREPGPGPASSTAEGSAVVDRTGGGDVARIVHDGPLWSLALVAEPDGALLIAAGGIEDHPLVREDGGFGYIDSFVYLYRLAPGAARPTRLAAVNVSELGVVTPKWIALAADADGIRVTTAGYATPSLLELSWRDHSLASEPIISHTNLLPGTAAADVGADGTLVAANPLLDAWVVRRDPDREPGPGPASSTAEGSAVTDRAPRVVSIASARPPRSIESRVGELLMFTTMMAPWNSSDGALSRFTCEACHYEGYADGRVHFTGRTNGADKVFATSRPLYGLFNNRPHFSRALDRTTTRMVHAEFRVANRHNGRDPWFGLSRADLPWLADFGAPERMTPAYLRQALMTFLADFSHRANPASTERAHFSALEAAGARAFRDRCASCHAARLVADAASSEVPFDRWEALVLSPSGPIVWSAAAYAKTGVTPYVHADGARAPSLRRLYKKWPYFTNGSARSLAEVLDRFAWDRDAAYHDRSPPGASRLAPDDKAALLAFLDLL